MDCRIKPGNDEHNKGTMSDESPKTKPEKLPKTKAELEALVLA